MTTNSANNSFVQDGQLYIVPTLTADVIGESAIFNGHTFNLTGCTSTNHSACAATSNVFTNAVRVSPFLRTPCVFAEFDGLGDPAGAERAADDAEQLLDRVREGRGRREAAHGRLALARDLDAPREQHVRALAAERRDRRASVSFPFLSFPPFRPLLIADPDGNAI